MKLIDTGKNYIDLAIKPISLEDELARMWVDGKKELKDIDFQTCRRDIKRAMSYLSYKYDRPRTEIDKVCAHLGARFLFSLPGVIEIRKARQYLIENCETNASEIRRFEHRFFDIGTGDLTRYHASLFEADKAQIVGLADILGLSQGIVCQVAFVYPLLFTSIPTQIYNALAKLFQRFCETLELWGQEAARTQRECKAIPERYRIPLEEVIPLESWDGLHQAGWKTPDGGK